MNRFAALLLMLFVGTFARAQDLPFAIANGQVQWSKVFEDDRDSATLILLASQLMANHCQISENSISGQITSLVMTSPDENYYDIFKYSFSGNVLYEFKDGRYRVTFSMIMLNDYQTEHSLKSFFYRSDGEYRKTNLASIKAVDIVFADTFKIGRYSDTW